MFTVIFLPPALLALWCWATLTFVYARGERAGYVQKFSDKGWVIKTWEGELAMVNLPGAMPEIFQFTVRDDQVAAQITQALGQRVAIQYEQHRGLPWKLFGDTSYFVTGLVAVPDPSMNPAPAADPAATPSDHPASR